MLQYIFNKFEYAISNTKPIVVSKYCCNSYASLPHMLKHNTTYTALCTANMYFATSKLTNKRWFEIMTFFFIECLIQMIIAF